MKRLAISIIIFLFSIITVFTQIIHVPGDYSTIQAAIDAAVKGDTVLVDEGAYFENLQFGSVSITLASRFIIDGDTSHISRTVIDGSQYTDEDDAAVICIKALSDDQSVVAGLTITGGAGRKIIDHPFYTGYSVGGGIFLNGCGVTIRNNIIEGNTIEQYQSSGAAVCLLPGESDTVCFFENTVRNNIAQGEGLGAGAILLGSMKHSVVRINNNIISNNIASSTVQYKVVGGGLFVSTGYSYGADIQIYNNIIARNELHCSGSFGGGIYVVYYREDSDPISETQVKIFNNIIDSNYSEDQGGGIGVWNMELVFGRTQHAPIDPLIINNTIIHNKATLGSGIFNYDANTLLVNNIIWNEVESSEDVEIFNDSVHDCFAEGPGWCKDQNDGVLHAYNNIIREGLVLPESERWKGFHNIPYEPMVNETSFNLHPGSLCIGNGVDSVEVDGTWYTIPTPDFMDKLRPDPVDDYIDIGAIESSYPHVPKFFLDTNDVTVKCYCHPGDTGTVNGIQYEAVDRELLEQRRDEGADLTILCTSLVTDMSRMFYDMLKFNQDISSWDVSNVIDMSRMFYHNWHFNQDISSWDVSNVTNMKEMFKEATSFNYPIGSWDVSNVTDMSEMFEMNTSPNYFDQAIGSWDVSNVIDMSGMFFGTQQFNQDIGSWNVSKVEDMSKMFEWSNFNQIIDSWDVGNVRDMSEMFANAKYFNQDIGSWDVGNVVDMSYMFYRTYYSLSLINIPGPFNQDISNWNVGKVTDMRDMFHWSIFNQDLGSWDVSNVTDMSCMFYKDSSFNQDLSGWCVENITSEPVNFAKECPLLEEYYPIWGTCPPPILDLSTDSIDLRYEHDLEIRSSKPGIVYMVPENTPRDLEEIKNANEHSYGVESNTWITIVIDSTHEEGNYWFYARDNMNNVSEPEILVIENTTRVEMNASQHFRLYPNPANDMISIELNNYSHSSEVKIISTTGQVLHIVSFMGSQCQIDLSGLSEGIYFITVSSEMYIATQKLLKR